MLSGSIVNSTPSSNSIRVRELVNPIRLSLLLDHGGCIPGHMIGSFVLSITRFCENEEKGLVAKIVRDIGYI
jgi:hypothetical protein